MVMLPQLSLMATLLLLVPQLLTDMLPAVAMLLILSELSIMPKEKLKLCLKPMLMPSMHLMDTTVLDTLAMVTTGLDMGLDTEVLVILVLDTLAMVTTGLDMGLDT